MMTRLHVVSPVVSYLVEEAVALVHHGSDSPHDRGVAHQAGGQHKVSSPTTVEMETRQRHDGKCTNWNTNSGVQLRLLPLCIEGICEEVRSGETLFPGDQIQTQEMPVKPFQHTDTPKHTRLT